MWFILERADTGEPISPFDPLPCDGTRLRVEGALSVSASGAHVSAIEEGLFSLRPVGARVQLLFITSSGEQVRLSLLRAAVGAEEKADGAPPDQSVLTEEGAQVPDSPVADDRLPDAAAEPNPQEPDVPPRGEVHSSSEAGTPVRSCVEALCVVAESLVTVLDRMQVGSEAAERKMPERWLLGLAAMSLLDSTEETAAIGTAVARIAEAKKQFDDALRRWTDMPAGDLHQTTQLALALERLRKWGHDIAWACSVRSARAQRLIYEEAAARMRRSGS